MKRRHTFSIVLGLFLVLGGTVAWQWDSILRAYYLHSIGAVTTALPHSDRVELFHIRSGDMRSAPGGRPANAFPVRPYGRYPTVLSTQTLSGAEAESFAALWRSQTYGVQFTALCHNPVYGLRFYSGSKLRFETTLCFHCSNFFFTNPLGNGFPGFDTSTPQAEALLRRLQQAFPASIPKTK